MMQKLNNRLARLEQLLAPKRQPRLVVRYEGPGSEGLPQPTQEEMEQNPVITVVFVEAKDGRPVDPTDSQMSGNVLK